MCALFMSYFIFSPKCTIFAYPTFNERDVKIPTHPVNLLLGKLLEDHQKTKKSTSGPPAPRPLLENPKLPHTKSDFLSPHKKIFFWTGAVPGKAPGNDILL